MDARHDLSALLVPGVKLQGRYTLMEKLGEGGFALVYEAHDAQVDRRVAVKLLNMNQIPPAALETCLVRFKREAKLAAQLTHPLIVTIFDYGTAEVGGLRLPFIVMERLQGDDMAEVLARDGVLSATRLWPLFCGALDALGEAHAAGIVHKDLKPSNLFLQHTDTPRESMCVVDFGIASVVDELQRITRTGLGPHTPPYIAPEYAAHQQVSPALDVYQMALILVELLWGRMVVEAPSAMAAVLLHTTGQLYLPRPLLDSPLGPELKRALALDPEVRHPDGDALAAALRAIDPATIPPLTLDAPLVSLRDWSAAPASQTMRRTTPEPLADEPGVPPAEVRRVAAPQPLALAETLPAPIAETLPSTPGPAPALVKPKKPQRPAHPMADLPTAPEPTPAPLMRPPEQDAAELDAAELAALRPNHTPVLLGALGVLGLLALGAGALMSMGSPEPRTLVTPQSRVLDMGPSRDAGDARDLGVTEAAQAPDMPTPDLARADAPKVSEAPKASEAPKRAKTPPRRPPTKRVKTRRAAPVRVIPIPSIAATRTSRLPTHPSQANITRTINNARRSLDTCASARMVVKLRLTINPQGVLTHLSVLSASPAPTSQIALYSCLRERFNALRFERSTDGTTLTYPVALR